MDKKLSKCPACGASINPDSGICEYCGAKFNLSETEAIKKAVEAERQKNATEAASTQNSFLPIRKPTLSLAKSAFNKHGVSLVVWGIINLIIALIINFAVENRNGFATFCLILFGVVFLYCVVMFIIHVAKKPLRVKHLKKQLFQLFSYPNFNPVVFIIFVFLMIFPSIIYLCSLSRNKRNWKVTNLSLLTQFEQIKDTEYVIALASLPD